MTGSHGLGRDRATPTWPPLTAAELTPLLARYGFCAPAPRWHSPRPWSTAAVVETASTAVFVKRHVTSVRSTADLVSEHAFSDHLRRNGFPTPAVLRQPDGSSVFACGDWRYEVFALADGDDAYRDQLSWTPYRSLAGATSAGALLADLHRAAASYDAPAREGPAGLGSAIAILASQNLSDAVLAFIRRRPALAGFVRDRAWEREITAALHEPGNALHAIFPMQRAQWGDGDWHGSNLFWDGDDAVAAIDLGLADRTCVAFDLAIAVERSGLDWLDLLEGTSPAVHQDQIDALLTGYVARAGINAAPVRELVEAVARFLPVVHVPLALAELDFYTRVHPDPANAQYAYDYLVGHACWFGAEGREALHRIASFS